MNSPYQTAFDDSLEMDVFERSIWQNIMNSAFGMFHVMRVRGFTASCDS